MATQRITELSKSESGEVVVADLLSEELSPEGFEQGEMILKTAYGRDYPKGKFELLFAMCTEDRWSEKRFFDTLRWVVKTNPYPEWKISEFFSAPLKKLYPRSWMVQQVAMGNKCKQYKIGDYLLYALASDELPFPEYVAPAPKIAAPQPEVYSSERCQEVLNELKQRAVVTKDRYSMAEPLGKIAEELTEVPDNVMK